MPLFTWTNKLSLNIEQIDNEHKQLVDILNDFYDNIISKTSEENIQEALAKLKNYVAFHFSNEERLLNEYNYPALPQHREEHLRLKNKVEEYENKQKSGKTVFSLEMTTFMKDWLTNHILGTDKAYADFLISKGVK